MLIIFQFIRQFGKKHIEFTVPEHSISSVRLKLIDVISFVRKYPALKSAIVTHTGFEPFHWIQVVIETKCCEKSLC